MSEEEKDENPFAGLFQISKKEQAFREEMQNIMVSGSEKVENELLMPLWQQLGDLGENYWQSIVAASVFYKSLRSVRRKCSELPDGLRILVIEAVAKCLLDDVGTLKLIDEAQQKAEHGSIPKPMPETTEEP